MAFRKIYDGLRIIAKAFSTSTKLGDLETIDADSDGEGIVTLHNGATPSQVLTADHAAEVTNKTISGASNTLTDIDGSSIVDNTIDLSKLSTVAPTRIIYSDSAGNIDVSDQLTSQKVVVTSANGLLLTATTSSAEIEYLAGTTSSVQDQLDDKLDLAGGTMQGTLDMDDNSITNIPDPVSNKDAVNKQYVDAIAQGLDLKSSVRVATTTSGTLSSSFENGDTVDGVVLAANDRILIKNQVSEVENGIYIVQASGSPLRSSDADTWAKLVGSFCFVEEGTVNADTGWACNIDSSGTINVNDVTFIQFSSAGVIQAGDALTKTGTTLDVNYDDSTIGLTGNELVVKAGGITDTEINASAAIARSKLASGTANHVVINDGSGVMSSEATLAKSRGGSGQDNSSLTFPASGTLATLAGTEVLTNKDYDGGTASNSSRLTLPKDTKANLDSLNRKEGTVVYATDQAKAFIDNGTSLVQIGSGSGGGGINYILNPDAEVNTDGWTSTRRVIEGLTNGTSETFSTGASANPYTFTTNEPLIAFSNLGDLTNGTTYYARTGGSDETELASTVGGSALNLSTRSNSVAVSPNFSGFYSGSSVSTWTRSTSSPLRGDASFLLTKPASLAAGDVHYYAFTIDSADQAKVMQITFDYSVVSGTYATGDVIVRIRDVTNGTVIQPSGYQIENVGVASVSRMTFQTASNSTSYELIFNIASVSTSAYTLKFDNIQLGPQVVPLGAPVTDWVSYTPTFNSTTGHSASNAWWYRIGDELTMGGSILFNNTGAASAFTVSLPSGLTIDTAKLNDSTVSSLRNGVGTWRWYDDAGGSSVNPQWIRVGSSTTLTFMDGSNSVISNIFANNDRISWQATVPIVGWSSSTVVSSSAATRAVAARLTGATNASFSAAAGVTWSASATLDTHGMYNGSNLLTCRVPGIYKVGAGILTSSYSMSATGAFQVFYRVNGGSDVRIGWTNGGGATINYWAGGEDTVRLNAGDTVEFRVSSTNTASLSGGYGTLEMLQGPSQIAMSEIIACRAYLSANQTGVNTNNSLVKVNFNATTLDTHGGWNTGTYRYTAPAPGIYDVATTIYTSASNVLANTYHPAIYVNGTEVQYGHPVPSLASTATGGYANWIGQLNAGDYVEIYWYGAGNNSASTMTLFGPSGTKNSSFHIKRLGGM